MDKTFIVLKGLLHENMEFDFQEGCEIQYAGIENPTIQQSRFIIAQLLDDQNQVLVRTTHDVYFPIGCFSNSSVPKLGQLLVTIPFHPSAHQIELRSYQRLLFSAPVGKIRPPAPIIHLESITNEGSINFKIDSSAETGHIEFFLINATGHRFSTTPVISGDVYSIDLRAFVGHKFLRLCASLSRDFRTSETISQSFKMPLGKIQGRILEPKNQSEWSAGSSINLIGNLLHENGKAVSWDPATISWILDDHVINDRRQIAVQEGLLPGEHIIELRYQSLHENPVVLDKVSINILEETEDQKKYSVIMAKYLATKKGEFLKL